MVGGVESEVRGRSEFRDIFSSCAISERDGYIQEDRVSSGVVMELDGLFAASNSGSLFISSSSICLPSIGGQ